MRRFILLFAASGVAIWSGCHSHNLSNKVPPGEIAGAPQAKSTASTTPESPSAQQMTLPELAPPVAASAQNIEAAKLPQTQSVKIAQLPRKATTKLARLTEALTKKLAKLPEKTLGAVARFPEKSFEAITPSYDWKQRHPTACDVVEGVVVTTAVL